MARFARNIVRLVVVLATTGAFVATALVAIGYSGYRLAQDAGTASELRLPDLVTGAAVPSVIYAANGAVMATLRSSLNRQPVSLDQIRPILIQAVLDTEDHSFWDHGGVDVESVVRAALADVNAGSAVQGGSTIAQQLVKSTYLTDQKTLDRKIREAVLAERLEEKYSKSQILDAYLNLVYLGSGVYGVEAASKEYFNEDADKVSLAQAALLAGLIQAPSGYDPLTNPVGARERRSQVLSWMVFYKSITPAQAAVANEVPLPTTVHDAPGVSYTSYGYYVDQVVNQLLDNPALGQTTDERYSALFTGGLKIYTNEEPPLQSYAQHVAAEDIPSSLAHVVAAFAVIDPRNGNVEALVGGPTGSNQFDDAVQGERQPGSGFKLFTLIGALEENYDVYDSILATSPCAVRFPGVALQYGYNLSHLMNNDPGDPNGVVSVVEATALSINCAYLRLAHEVGLQKVIDVAKSMGLSDPTLNPKNPSLVIGTEAVHPIEMASAYATVADGGVYHAPTFVSRVVDRSGGVIYKGESEGVRVFSDQIADEAIVALRATVQYGTGTAAALPNAEVAGKTGTTENSVDAWFNGITPTLVSSVWIGDPKGEVPMYVNGVEVFGADYPTQIWHDVMSFALKDVPYTAFPPPDPSLMAPVKYIDSDALAEDDLLSHGGYISRTCVASGAVNPCPTTTTRAPTTTRPPPTTVPRTTTSVFVLPPPPTGDLTPGTVPPTTIVPATTSPPRVTTSLTTSLPPTTVVPATTSPPRVTTVPVTTPPPSTTAVPVTAPHHTKPKVTVTTPPPPVTTVAPVTTTLPVTTTSLVTAPTAALPAATTVPSGTSVPPTTTLAGLRAARADLVRVPEIRHVSQQARGSSPAGKGHQPAGEGQQSERGLVSQTDFDALLALQDLDTHIDQEVHKKAQLPERAELAELERLIGQAQAARSVVAVALGEVASRQEAAERELKVTEDRVVQVNRRLYGGTVTASRELQAMSEDVEGLKKRASELEDKALGLMEEREPFDTEIASLDGKLAELTRRQRDTVERLGVAESEVDASIASLTAQRPGAVAAVPPALLTPYDRLRSRLGGVAVARLVGGRCDGCHLSLPAMELDRIRHQSAGSLETCEQCGRILVIAGH